MSLFTEFSDRVHARFNLLANHELFVVDVSKDEIWDAYLAAFPTGTNPIFRERTEHDCSCCRQFVKNLGNVVAIIDGKVQSIWDVTDVPYPYDVVAAKLNRLVMGAAIVDLFRTTERKIGTEYNFEPTPTGNPIKWEHFHARVPQKFYHHSPQTPVGERRTLTQVFKRGLDELSLDALETVLGLIDDNALYRGASFRHSVEQFTQHLRKYRSLSKAQANIFVWYHSGKDVARFRNTAIGTLVQDLSDGVALERAVSSFETKVAPTNYKRTSAIITPAMVKNAMKTIHELGLEPALERRFAKLSDLSVNNVLWVSNDVQDKMQDGVESLLMAATQVSNASAAPVEMSMDTFMQTVAPQAQSMELFVSNALQNRFMSLTAPVNPDAPQLFQWNNNFAWSYDGNITDSIKERVKTAGGNVEASLRFSLAWFNTDDLDIHVVEPGGKRIYFGNPDSKLDVDMNAGGRMSTNPVENVSYTAPKDGTYIIEVNQYCQRNRDNVGFVLEVADLTHVKQFSYDQTVTGTVKALEVRIEDGRVINITPHKDLTGGGIPTDKWGVTTENFMKVNTLLHSPNHWDDEAKGNKHWFFILEGCRNPEPTRGIYNEYLPAHLNSHRKVFEVLGSKTMCPPTDEQLSGVGFSETRTDDVLVKVTTAAGTRHYALSF